MIVIAVALLFTLVGNPYCQEVKGANTPRVGQWIWSARDKKIFSESRKAIPDLVPAIWVSTIGASQGTISQRLACSPSLGKSVPSIAVVVRFEDSVHELWKTQDPGKIAQDIDSRLGKLMGILAGADMHVKEVQLDYDCPVRRLRAWAKVVRSVSAGSLKGNSVWITSIPAHLNEFNYSAWFRGAVGGHILQLFDTGVPCNQDTLRRLSDKLCGQSIPFRIGLGAFERIGPRGMTDHRLWFSALSSFTAVPGYQGIWVFPGGKRWLDLYPVRTSY